MKISDLSKAEKIELIKRIAAGDETLIINGNIIGNGLVLIEKDGNYYLDCNQLSEVDLARFKEKFTGTLILIPDNGRDKILKDGN